MSSFLIKAFSYHNKNSRSKELAVLFLLFAFGGAVYSLLETLYRGYTHWTMALTGGACTATLYALSKPLSKLKLWKKCGIGSLIITSYEFVVGCIVNLWFGWQVWDYSAVPGNLLGQICPLFSLIWFMLCAPLFVLCSWLRKILT
ncbi:MAG: hypothetical protein VB100_02620 [Angelakisella sp.]|nr:hypothetical protein [Angelakisella sp.]